MITTIKYNQNIKSNQNNSTKKMLSILQRKIKTTMIIT